MGCLKKIIQSIILCLAFIGFMSIGGGDFVKTKFDEFLSKQSTNVEKKASEIGDFSNISDEFEISQTASLFKYNGVIAEHKSSGQKMVIFESKNGSDLITADDIINNRTEEKINNLTTKFKYSAIKIQDLKLGSKGELNAYGKNNPYVKFSAKISKIPIGDIEGIISAYEDEDKNKLLISVNEKNKYSQIVAQEFFKKVKK